MGAYAKKTRKSRMMRGGDKPTNASGNVGNQDELPQSNTQTEDPPSTAPAIGQDPLAPASGQDPLAPAIGQDPLAPAIGQDPLAPPPPPPPGGETPPPAKLPVNLPAPGGEDLRVPDQSAKLPVNLPAPGGEDLRVQDPPATLPGEDLSVTDPLAPSVPEATQLTTGDPPISTSGVTKESLIALLNKETNPDDKIKKAKIDLAIAILNETKTFTPEYLSSLHVILSKQT